MIKKIGNKLVRIGLSKSTRDLMDLVLKIPKQVPHNFKFRKQGKTRGRRSKVEVIAEEMANKWFKRNEKKIQKQFHDLNVFGISSFTIDKNTGNLK